MGRLTLNGFFKAEMKRKAACCFSCKNFNDKTGLCSHFKKTVPPYFMQTINECKAIELEKFETYDKVPF